MPSDAALTGLDAARLAGDAPRGAPLTDLHAAFGPARTLIDYDGNRFRTRREPIGHLALPSGRLGVGDLLVSPVDLPSPGGPLPEGPHPVDLCVAVCEHNSDERAAALRIRFSERPAVRWERAEVGADVDAGCAGFIDGAAVATWTDRPENAEELISALELSQQTRRQTCDVAAAVIDGVPVIACSSGWGDGVYDGWWGFDEDGAVCAYVLDFDVLTTRVVDWLPVPHPLQLGRIEHPMLVSVGAEVRLEGPFVSGLMAMFGVARSPTRLVLRWQGRQVIARWRPPEGPSVAPAGRFLDARAFSCDLSDPPAGAALWLAVVGEKIPMPEAAGR